MFEGYIKTEPPSVIRIKPVTFFDSYGLAAMFGAVANNRLKRAANMTRYLRSVNQLNLDLYGIQLLDCADTCMQIGCDTTAHDIGILALTSSEGIGVQLQSYPELYLPCSRMSAADVIRFNLKHEIETVAHIVRAMCGEGDTRLPSNNAVSAVGIIGNHTENFTSSLPRNSPGARQ